MNAFVVMADADYHAQFAALYYSIRRFHPRTPILLYSWDEWPAMPGVEVRRTPYQPWEHILGRADAIAGALGTHERIMFLGADTELFRPVDEAFALLDDSEIVLTPHNCVPLASPEELVRSGMGVVNSDVQLWRRSAVTARASSWYRDRIRKTCEPWRLPCIDQFWLSLIPTLFDGCRLWRTMCYNVAYWNVDSYHLRRVGDGYATDGGPLAIYHYSGFSSPEVLSRHMPLPTTGDVRHLYTRYASLLSRYAE